MCLRTVPEHLMIIWHPDDHDGKLKLHKCCDIVANDVSMSTC